MTFDEVRCFEFEISRLCNARCPLCTRTEILDNPKMEDFPQDFISLEQIKKVFDGYDLKNKWGGCQRGKDGINCTSSIELVGVPIRQGWQELSPITFCHGVQLAN